MADIRRRVVVIALADTDFGGDVDLFAAAGKGFQAVFEDGLAGGPAVDIGMVVERDAGVHRRLEGGNRGAAIFRPDFGGVPGSGQAHASEGDA